MNKDIRNELIELADSEYQKFTENLTPGAENVLGIRLPILRKMAKQIAKGDWEKAISEVDLFYEEVMLRGMVLSCASYDFDKMQPFIKAFIPKVDNWAICDSVFTKMTVFQKDRERTWEFIMPYLYSDKEFEVRVALIIMMQHLLKCDSNGIKIAKCKSITVEAMENNEEVKGLYCERIFNELNRPYLQGYYASMAASWLIAEAFCVFPYTTTEFLLDNQLDDQTHNKAIQKIIESKIPTVEVKDKLRKLKRKK